VSAYDLSGLGIHLSGLPHDLAARLARDWAPFAAPAAERWLDVRVELVERDYAEAVYRPKAMRARVAARGAAFAMPEGEAEVDATGVAQLRLVSGTGERRYFTLLNLLRACLAWRLPERGGAMLHAAGLVVDGVAFLLVGAEGSGKSTWTRLGEQAGAEVVSDDLILLDGANRRLEVLGAPFRSTHAIEFRVGRWPLAAVLFPIHGATPAWHPVAGLLSRARLAANLPFVADGLEQDGRLLRSIDRVVGEVPCGELTFAPDTRFVELLRRWAPR